MEEILRIISAVGASGILSIAGAVASILGTIVSLVITRRRASARLKEASELEFDNLLEQPELSTLGAYLDDRLGGFTIEQYAVDAAASERVNSILEAAREFLDKDSGTAVPEPPRPQISLGISLHRPLWLERIRSELQEGEPWNALAQLRREIEIRLRNEARQQGVKVDRIRGAGRLLQALLAKELVDPDSGQQLRYSISVANRAVHGEDVSLNESEDAIEAAARALARMPSNRGNDG